MTDITIRPMREGDLAEADRIVRLAFGAFLQLPDPMLFGASGSALVGIGRGTTSVTGEG